MTKHIAIYCRVSTSDQSVASQMPDLQRYADAQELPVVWYSDTWSGKTMDRPAWADLQAAINAGKVSAVVVWRLDRLGRTASGLTKLFDELHTKRINLVSLKDGIDLATSAGRLMANVLASVAQYETEVRAERVKAGQAAAKAKGKTWGGSKPGKRKISAEREQAIRDLYDKGTPITQIAIALGISRPTIYSVLEDAKCPS